MAEKPKQYVIVAGSLGGGFGLVGPFDDQEEALREAEAWAADYEHWEVMEMEPPLDAAAETEVVSAVAGIRAPQHDDDWED